MGGVAAMAVAFLFAVSAQSADRASLETAFAKVRAVADDICTVTSVQLLSKADPAKTFVMTESPPVPKEPVKFWSPMKASKDNISFSFSR